MNRKLSTHAEIAKDLLKLSREMLRLGNMMDYCGGFGVMGNCGRQMIGAAKIAKSWVPEIRKLNLKQAAIKRAKKPKVK